MILANFNHPNAGNDYDREKTKRLLFIGLDYEVENISMGQSYTNISLSDFDDKFFNSVNFDFFEKIGDKITPLDIYNDKRFNPYL